MREFEKWNKEQHHFVLKRETWRAALEMVESAATAIALEEDAGGFDIGDLHKLIEQELKESEDEGNQ